MALGILGQVGVQVELVAELPCEDAFVFPQGCDDVGRVGFQELCRFAARPAPAAERLAEIFRHGGIMPHQAGDQSDFQFLRAGRDLTQRIDIGVPVGHVRGSELGAVIDAAVEADEADPFFLEQLERCERVRQVDPQSVICEFERAVEQVVAVHADVAVLVPSKENGRLAVRVVFRPLDIEALARPGIVPIGLYGFVRSRGGSRRKAGTRHSRYGQYGSVKHSFGHFYLGFHGKNKTSGP